MTIQNMFRDSKRNLKCLVVVGTRPEAIKMAPVIAELTASERCDPVVCLSGRHPEMAAQALSMCGITAEISLARVDAKGDLSVGMGHVLREFSPVLADVKPDWVLVHGDTMTTLSATLAAFHAQTRVAHVEAGLRTGAMRRP
ncbi:UDP-N-acetyl glucosamine 2-epimerase [Escherichia coli]|nr:UDP-N-acetyl glucosamine 2-epimerase [Escherichia coli]